MRSLLKLTATLALAILVAGPFLMSAQAQVGGLNIYQATLMEPDQRTGEVSTDELKQILTSGGALVYDSRPALQYAIGHIPGALSAPHPGIQPAAAAHLVGIQQLAPDTDTAVVLYCNGVYWPLSKRLGEALSEAGYSNVRRYQIGMPVWRALGGIVQIEREGIRYVLEQDRGAMFVDARDPIEFQAGSLPGARNILLSDVGPAMSDGRLPMEDPGRRIVAFGADGTQARDVAQALTTRAALNNVAYFDGGPGVILALAP